MQHCKLDVNGFGPFHPTFKDEAQNQILPVPYKQQWIAKATRVPPRKVHTTDLSRIKSRLFAFNQRNCALSIGTVVGSFRYICSWAKLLGLSVSAFLFVWTLYCFSILKYLKGEQYIEYFYTNLLCLMVSLISFTMLAASFIFPGLAKINLNSVESSLITNSGMATRSLIPCKTLSTMYFIVSLFSIFPTSLFQMDSYYFTAKILSVILATHLAPSILFYVAHLRGEDGYIDERNMNTSL
ncbi:membrane domain-containing protein [Cryptosporidium canis]|uniref:Membrane domain-containing protein n=1 Tax=Cryptosporidium canis TaxID=195482 RepID=A0A9D5DHU0_9CRYT|nr:membrane domain-containing protein [Cryptosporidium canis]